MSPAFGWRVPPIHEDHTSALIRDAALACESAGLDSFWLPDRLTAVEGYLDFLAEADIVEPLIGLGYAAALTTRIRLGTAALVAPFRHPVALAKAASSLQALCGDRLVLGVGTGWNRSEFRAVGVDPGERGGRTDETLDILRRAREGRPFEHHGRFFDLDRLSLRPPLRPSLRLWVAGGPSAQAAYGAVGGPLFSEPVLDRVSRADGWLARPVTSPDQLRAGIEAIRARRPAGGTDYTVAQVNWCHLVDGTRDQALREQEPLFARALGPGTPMSLARRLHWTGSLSDVRERVEALLEAGVDHVIASPLSPDPEQIELWVRGVIEPMGISLDAAGGGR